MKFTCKKAFAQGDEVEIDDIEGLESHIDGEVREAKRLGKSVGYECGYDDACDESTVLDPALLRDLGCAIRRRNFSEAEFLLDKIVAGDANHLWAVELGRYGTGQKVAA